MLAVVTAAAAEDLALVGGCLKFRLGEDARDRGSIFVLESARIWGEPRIDRGLQRLINLEQLGHEAPAPIEPLGHASRAFVGAVAEPHRPFARQFAVIGDFLHCFGREFAHKAVKEVAYHRELASDWTIRLGDGTDESTRRMAEGLDWNWRFVPELFEVDEAFQAAIDAGIAPDPRQFEEEYRSAISAVFAEAQLEAPADQRPILGGRRGHHSEHLGHLLAVMQFLPRTYPDATW